MLHGSSNEPTVPLRRSPVSESHSEVPLPSIVTREPIHTVVPGVAETRNPQDALLRNSTSSQVSCDNTTAPNVEDDTLTVDAIQVPSGVSVRTTYAHIRVIGTGSFGVVYIATLTNNGEQEVAIKKVLQDERYKNRELQILKDLSHANVVALYYYFYSVSSSKPDETYLNLVQEFVPQTLNRLIKHYWRIRQVIPLALVKLYSFQLLRGLAYIHSRQVCHRDIKPQNLLINPEQGVLKICDFGSAKILSPEESNVSYICSRYYRAPELIFGATHYTVLVDMWSAGCVIGELLLGRPLFPGGSGVDQLVEIIKVLGTPTPEQIFEMNPQYSEFNFPNITGCPWEKVIRHRTTDSAFSVLRSLLVYSPKERMSAANILADCFFADLIFPPPGHPPYATGHLPSGKPAPQFPAEFTDSELDYLPSDLVSRIRECKDAVAEVALRASIQADPLSDGSGAERFDRVRSHMSRDDLPSSSRSTGFTRKKFSLSDRSDINGRPSSKALMATSVIDSRTRVASLSTVRLSDSIEGKLDNHPKTNVGRSSSHLTQSVMEESDADPASRLSSKPRTLLNRHNLRGKPASKASHTRHW